MNANMEQQSQIENFYAGATVLLTGSTSYFGKIILEKLLRTCTRIEKIYLVIRRKNGKTPKERLNEMFKSHAFNLIQPEAVFKVSYLEGDATFDGYGFSEESRKIIKENVNVIINNASTSDFGSTFKTSIKTNVGGLRSLLDLAGDCKNLRAFIQISSVYSNFDRMEIEETIYDPPMEADKLLSLAETMGEDYTGEFEKKILGSFPNNVLYTKAVAESLIRKCPKPLPVCLVRPSLVFSTYKEPVEGWVESSSSLTRLSTSFFSGVFHMPMANKKMAADIMPADYAANAVIACGWAREDKLRYPTDDLEVYQTTINEKIFSDTQTTSEVPVFNLVSSTLTVLTWEQFWENLRIMSDSFPPKSMIWFQYYYLTRCRYFYNFMLGLFHVFPAYVLDFFSGLFGRRWGLVDMVNDCDKTTKMMLPITSREFVILNHNTQNLWRRMNTKDKELFGFDISRLDWFKFIKFHAHGCRKFILGEDMENLPEAIKRHRLSRMANHFSAMFLVYIVGRIIMNFFGISFLNSV